MNYNRFVRLGKDIEAAELRVFGNSKLVQLGYRKHLWEGGMLKREVRARGQ